MHTFSYARRFRPHHKHGYFLSFILVSYTRCFSRKYGFVLVTLSSFAKKIIDNNPKNTNQNYSINTTRKTWQLFRFGSFVRDKISYKDPKWRGKGLSFQRIFWLDFETNYALLWIHAGLWLLNFLQIPSHSRKSST